MKKLFLSAAAVLLVAVGANAQNFSKGDWFLGASVSNLQLDHAFVDGDSATSFELQAQGGYFVGNKFAVDLGVGAGIVEDISAFTFGVGVRYYPVGNFFARVGFDGAKIEDLDLLSQLGVSLGYDLFVSDNVFFEPSVYYRKILNDGGANSIGLSLGVGARF
ncbi:MAG: hypothetical protein LBV18_07250 [Alistipes sp.]|jgi:hypothetical protein|nr:hypothetical protein [Alistipes sp.]